MDFTHCEPFDSAQFHAILHNSAHCAQFRAIPHNNAQFCTIPRNTLQLNTILRNNAQFYTIQRNFAQFCAILHLTAQFWIITRNGKPIGNLSLVSFLICLKTEIKSIELCSRLRDLVLNKCKNGN